MPRISVSWERKGKIAFDMGEKRRRVMNRDWERERQEDRQSTSARGKVSNL